MWSLAAALLLYGCETTCVGVGCEEDFGAARLMVHTGATLPESGEAEITADTPVIVGTENEGPEWDVVVSASSLMIGSQLDGSVRSIGATPGVSSTADSDGIIVGAANGDGFGSQVAVYRTADDSASLLIAAPLHSVSAATRHDGAVYRFEGKGSGFTGGFTTLDASLRITGEESGARFGAAVAICPDLDGDGAEEWLIASPRSNTGAEMAGAVTLILSSELSGTEAQTGSGAFVRRWYSEDTGARSGHALSCRDDVNGDSIPDLLIGAPFADGPDETDAVGAVYIVSGASLPEGGPLSTAAETIVYGTVANDWLGFSLQTGDFDGNGRADLLVGAPGADKAAGEVRMWLVTDALSDSPSLTLNGQSQGDGFGHSLRVGDANNDGMDDLFIGAPFVNPDQDEETFDAGSISIHFGRNDWTGLTDRTPDVLAPGSDQYQRTGRRIFVGDMDGDGMDDLVAVQRTAEE